jgi:hypothetical protein
VVLVLEGGGGADSEEVKAKGFRSLDRDTGSENVFGAIWANPAEVAREGIRDGSSGRDRHLGRFPAGVRGERVEGDLCLDGAVVRGDEIFNPFSVMYKVNSGWMWKLPRLVEAVGE